MWLLKYVATTNDCSHFHFGLHFSKIGMILIAAILLQYTRITTDRWQKDRKHDIAIKLQRLAKNFGRPGLGSSKRSPLSPILRWWGGGTCPLPPNSTNSSALRVSDACPFWQIRHKYCLKIIVSHSNTIFQLPGADPEIWIRGMRGRVWEGAVPLPVEV